MIPLPLISLGFSLLQNWQRIAIYAALAAAVLGITWMHGYGKGSARLFEAQAEQARAAVAIVLKQGAVTERVVTRYVEVAGATQVVTQYVDREVSRYAESNPGSCLDPDWRRLHDLAASNRLPDAPGAPHGPVRTPDTAPGRRTLAPGS